LLLSFSFTSAASSISGASAFGSLTIVPSASSAGISSSRLIRLKVADIRIMGRATQGVRLINLEKRNDQIGSVCKVMTESLEDEIPAEEAEGTIVSDPNAILFS